MYDACLSHLSNFSQILMSAAEQSLAEFQAVLEKHRANEATYKDRLKDINLTRGKIADQLEVLQQTYDKKLKGLEQKLEALKGQNDGLVRENALYKSEIETYQSRLLEKEKIIAALLGQRKDLPIIGSSERSKSEKTDSLNANQEESKIFKKAAVSKSDLEHSVGRFKQEPAVERQKQQADTVITQKIEKAIEKSPKQEIKPPKKKVPPPPAPPQNNNSQEHPHVEHTVNNPKAEIEPEEVKAEPVEARHPPPPPPPQKNNKKTRKSPPISRKFDAEPYRPEENLDANNFFSSLGRTQQVVEVKAALEQQVEIPQITHAAEEEQVAAPIQPASEEAPHEEVEEIHPLPDEINHAEYEFQVKEQEEVAKQEQNEDQYQHEQHYHHHSKREQRVQPQQENYEGEYQQNQVDFLSHFNQPQHQITQEEYFRPPPVKSKAKAKKKVVQEETAEVNGIDFFTQLSKGEHQQHHHLQIEESSIDHIDRDNSLLSNEQPYFMDEPVRAKKTVKMPKKKVKRDLKNMDAISFE